MNYGLKDEDLKAMQNVLARFKEIEQAIIYGSRAKGNFKSASDIDITLKGDRLNTSLLNAVANQMDDLLMPYQIDLSVYHHITNADLLEHINRVGKILYEKNDLP